MAKISPDEPCPCGASVLFKECHGAKVQVKVPPEIKQKIMLKVIPEPDPNTRTVFEKIGEGSILFQGFETNIALVCGACNAVLAAGMASDKVRHIILRCNLCGSFNDTA
ncbi:MAG: SEC-C metal-binding domain-containing protein [Blastocatellales bacterium]